MNKKLLLQVILAAGAAVPASYDLPAPVAVDEPAFSEPAMPILRQPGRTRPAAMPVLRFSNTPAPAPMPIMGAKTERPAFTDERLREVFDGTRKPK